MKNEEEISILEQRSNLLRKFQHIKEAESVEISKEELNAPALFADQYRKEANAIDLAIRVLKGQPTGEPLTLEQLREMVDEPAYLYIYDTALDSGWEIIKAVTKDKIIFRGWNTVYVPISSLGKCFDLYAYPPAHIDREAWTSCVCNSGKKTCCTCISMQCDSCIGESKYKQGRYCSACGRPLTEKAWAELEKRLRGISNG